MRSLKLTLAYDGTAFVGWQRQAEGTSIQGLLEAILTAIDGAPVAVAGAGRTDAGVHALGAGRQLHARQHARHRHAAPRVERAAACRRARARRSRRSPPRFTPASRPQASGIGTSWPTARWSAPSPPGSAWHLTGRLDLAAMQQAAAHLVGTHDFSAFQSTGTDVAHAVRTVTPGRDRRRHRPAPVAAAGRRRAWRAAAGLRGRRRRLPAAHGPRR